MLGYGFFVFNFDAVEFIVSLTRSTFLFPFKGILRFIFLCSFLFY